MEVSILFHHLNVSLVVAVMAHPELEQICAFAPLNYLIVELGSDVGPFDASRAPASIHVIAEEEDVDVVRCLWPTVLHRAPLSAHHQDDQYKVAKHINDRDYHHGGVLSI